VPSPHDCPLCRQRKAKRACPALGRNICATCCATKRLTEINCPPSCAYLSSARAHPPAVVQRRRERDLRFLMPLLAELSERQYQLLLYLQALIVKHAEAAIPPLTDADIAEACAVVAKTFETASKGIIYEHQAASVPAQRLATDLGGAISEMRRKGAPPAIERDATTALRTLERAARTADKALAGDETPMFLGLLRRLMATIGERRGDSSDTPPAGGSGLIIPG
jgi:hypothetical protein